MHGTLIDEAGLAFRSAFVRDAQFYLALAAAPAVLAALAALLPPAPAPVPLGMPLVLSMALWQPLVEELLFRGVLQGQLERMCRARRPGGISCANCATTLLFALAHLVHHAPLWAAAVIAPSLVFGYFRDRHRQVYPAFLLHAFYNGCYLLAGMPGAR